MLKLYENIKKYRKAAGLTQEELAKKTGYTDRSSIAKVEKGAVDLSQSKIKQFAEALGVSAGQLMGWEGDPEDTADLVARVLLDPALLKLVEQYLSLPEGDQYVARITVASLAEKEKTTDARGVGHTVKKTISLLEIE